MKKFNSLLILLFTIHFCIPGNAQKKTTSIQEIQAYYYKLKEQMKASSEAEYSTYYVLKIEENVDKASMPAVGNYYGTEEFWYLPNEETGSYGREGTLVYRKSKFQIGAREEWTEYVFKEGILIFCFIRIAGAGEHRYYFKDETLIKYSEKESQDPFYTKDDWKYLLKHAKQ